MIYEMAVTTDNCTHFIKLVGYTKREAIALAEEHEEVTLYADAGRGEVLFQRLKEEGEQQCD